MIVSYELSKETRLIQQQEKEEMWIVSIFTLHEALTTQPKNNQYVQGDPKKMSRFMLRFVG